MRVIMALPEIENINLAEFGVAPPCPESRIEVAPESRTPRPSTRRYAVLFDPVRIGPVTAPNRFYQVPHASGMTNALPHVRARFRETKAEGGWGVVCTGAVSIHPSSDDAPLPFATLVGRERRALACA